MFLPTDADDRVAKVVLRRYTRDSLGLSQCTIVAFAHGVSDRVRNPAQPRLDTLPIQVFQLANILVRFEPVSEVFGGILECGHMFALRYQS